MGFGASSHIHYFARQKGIGLIELMVSITIGLFVLAGVLQLYATSTQNVSTFEGSSRIQENARYAFNKFEKDIGQAGNMGCFSFTTVNNRIDNVLTDPDLTAPGKLYDFTRFIDGESATGPGSTASDKLIVRFASTEDRYPIVEISSDTITLPDGEGSNFEAGDIAIVGDCSTATIFSVSDKSANSIEYSENLIGNFVSSANADEMLEGTSMSYVYGGESGALTYNIGLSAAGGVVSGACNATTPEYCALFRGDIEIVEGVEDLQFEYGWQNAAGNLFFKDSAAIDSGASANEDWANVDRVRVTATFNSINTANTNEGIDLLRRTYSRVFVIHNQLPLCADC